MNILMISGSRNRNGQTARAADALLAGAEEEGASVERTFLPELRIERCRQCEDNGWGICRSEGKCIIEDDFAGLIDNIRDADAVVVATPVYFSDLSESLRAFLDRFRRTTRHASMQEGLSGKPAVGVCVAGGGGGGANPCCMSLEKVLATCGFDVVDMVPVRRQNLDNKVKTLSITGKWLANGADGR